MRGEVKMGFSFLRRIGNLTRLVHASGGLLFPRGKSNQKRAKTKVLESFTVDKRGIGRTVPKCSIVSAAAPLPLTL